MHHCLNIEEIVEAICEQVFLLQDGPASLLAFGLACYALLEPALDRLWRTQTNLSPLVRVLPADSWTYFGKNIVVSHSICLMRCVRADPLANVAHRR